MADETRESKIKDCQIQAFWQRFLKANPRNKSPLTYEDAWSFGDTPQMADELAAFDREKTTPLRHKLVEKKLHEHGANKPK